MVEDFYEEITDLHTGETRRNVTLLKNNPKLSGIYERKTK